MEFPQLTQANPIGSALEGYQTGQKIQSNKILLEQNRLENIRLQQENNKKYAVSEARRIAYSGDPRAPEAMKLLGSLDPDEGKKAADWHKDRSQRIGTYMTVINNAPEKDKAKIYGYIAGQINSGSDPFVTSEDFKRAGFSDTWSSDKAPKVAALAQMHRDLENATKAPQEAADLEATKASTTKTYADIARIREQTKHLKINGGEKPPQGYRFTANGNLEAIEGGPANKLTPEQAGKSALTEQGLKDVGRFRNLIAQKDAEGNIKGYDRKKLAALTDTSIPFIPGSGALGSGTLGAREEYSTLFNAINARLRMESGQAVPETEVRRAIKTFAPKVGDSDKTITSKLTRMEEFFNLAKEKAGEGRSPKNGAENARLKYNPTTGAVE